MKKKRLFSGIFLQLFLGFWAVILVLGFSVSVISASYLQTQQNPSVDSGYFGNRATYTARELYASGGKEVLLSWLSDPKINNHPVVFAIDAEGKDLLGRQIPKSLKTNLRGPQITVDNSTLTLVAVRNTPKRGFALWRIPLWIHLLLALFATSSIALLMAWYFAKPIRKLDDAMRKAMTGNFDERVSLEFGRRFDEIGDLAKRYDEMAEKINGLLTRQKRLFHDVSHELRSPLARIQVALALLEKDPEKFKTSVSRIENEVAQLDALVEELLTYARLDKNAPITFEQTDLRPILDAVAENADFEGSACGISVKVSAPETIPMSCHIESLASAFENLIRNALRFSPHDAQIDVSATVDENFVTVTIEDQGPGMDESDIARMFQPFVRGANQATGSGFGLGLAIAKRAILRHKGTIEARNKTPHGLQIHLQLPLRQ